MTVPAELCIEVMLEALGGPPVRLELGAQAVKQRQRFYRVRQSCWERGLKGSLSKALRVEITTDDFNELMHYMDQLPETND